MNQFKTRSRAPKFTNVIPLVVALTICIFTLGYLWQIWLFGIQGIFDLILQKHFVATVGLPMAALAAASIVTIFDWQSNSIYFEGLGFKFSGASGRIILWIFCFLAIVISLKILW